jgi:peptidoglycan/xylan/chitin deacetylase (PgdA/CDA1 family)
MKKIWPVILWLGFGMIFCGCQPDFKENNQPDRSGQTAEKKILPEKLAVPILIYHHIDSELPPAKSAARTFYVTPTELESQLKYLKENNFQTISTENLAQAFAGNFSLPAKPVIITFDDGLPTQYQNAFLLLKKYDLTATFYIFTNAIGISRNYLTWEQVRELAESGMEIGSHTRYHHYLTKEANEEDLREEIIGSKEKIERELNIKVSAFSYPFGSYDATSTEMVKAAGYLTARDIVNGQTQLADKLFGLKAYFVTSDFDRFKRIINND